MYIDGAVTAVDGGPKNIGIGLPGTIRIGHSRPSSSSPASLTGRVACFMIQDVLYNHGSLNTDIQDCKSSNWVLTPGKMGNKASEKETLHFTKEYLMHLSILSMFSTVGEGLGGGGGGDTLGIRPAKTLLPLGI